MAERLGNLDTNQKVASLIPGGGSRRCDMMLCPWARHFTLFASG